MIFDDNIVFAQSYFGCFARQPLFPELRHLLAGPCHPGGDRRMFFCANPE